MLDASRSCDRTPTCAQASWLGASTQPRQRRRLDHRCSDAHRKRVLTADDTGAVRRLLADAFGAFAESERTGCMNRPMPMPTLPSGTADAVLDALPHPVIMVSADGQDRQRQCGGGILLRGLAAAAAPPYAAGARAVRQPAAGADRAGARARRCGQRIQGRSWHSAQSRRTAGRSACRAAAGASQTMSW